MWLCIAVAHGHADAEQYRGTVASEMRFWNAWEAKRLAREWLEEHGD